MARGITIVPPQSINDLRDEIADVILDPDLWIETPNDQLGGRKPIDLVNSADEAERQRVRDLIEAIKHGMFT